MELKELIKFLWNEILISMRFPVLLPDPIPSRWRYRIKLIQLPSWCQTELKTHRCVERERPRAGRPRNVPKWPQAASPWRRRRRRRRAPTSPAATTTAGSSISIGSCRCHQSERRTRRWPTQPTPGGQVQTKTISDVVEAVVDVVDDVVEVAALSSVDWSLRRTSRSSSASSRCCGNDGSSSGTSTTPLSTSTMHRLAWFFFGVFFDSSQSISISNRFIQVPTPRLIRWTRQN